MKGILVRTGKYIADIEKKAPIQPTNVADSFSDAVDWLYNHDFSI